MNIFISLNADNSIASWASSKGMDSEIEIEIADDSTFFGDNPFLYAYQNGQLVKSDTLALYSAKTQKISELDVACNKTILGNFTYQYSDGNTYSFGNDESAQSNFDKVLNAFDKSMVTAMTWTAYDINNNVVRLSFDSTSYLDLYKAHLNHIQSNISKFRDTLEPQVNACTTVDQVNAIVWEGN